MARFTLIVPDAALHLLPFAALPDPGAPQRYLVEGRPLWVAASVTVFAGQKRLRGRDASGPLAAFGDPAYPAADLAPAVDRSSAARLAVDLAPLPASRIEVQALAAAFGGGAEVFVGAEATEERVRDAAPAAGVVHFACHGLLDERFPLESALVLSIPAAAEGRENGLLQASEIFEELRLRAGLVTLSACNTALGREMAGEGILGLTRAFQHAGARSVLASLWNVADWSTTELMRRFYRELRAGSSAAEALRAAQLALIREPLELERDGQRRTLDASHPYHWAGFELFGDWR
jgi:CHAT domain-containing protein